MIRQPIPLSMKIGHRRDVDLRARCDVRVPGVPPDPAAIPNQTSVPSVSSCGMVGTE